MQDQLLPWASLPQVDGPDEPMLAPAPKVRKAALPQLQLPWGQYTVTELSRVLGATDSGVRGALKRLGLVRSGTRRIGVPADMTQAVKAEVDRVQAILKAARDRSRGKKLDRQRQRMERMEHRDRMKALKRVGL